MNEIRSVCVYCGSGPGANPRFIEAAKALEVDESDKAFQRALDTLLPHKKQGT